MSQEASRNSLLIKRVYRLFERKHAVQAAAFATIFLLPLFLFLVSTSRVLLPLNVLPECCGWSYADTEWKPYNLQISDVVDFILPMKIYTYESLKSGSFPLWNPYFFGGGELFSNSQSAILHPANILYTFMGPLVAHTISVIASIFTMLFFSYLLVRKLGGGFASACIGALMYVSIPWVVFWLEWGTIGWVMAVWPGILYFLYVFKESKYRNFSSYAMAILLAGTQFYFGHMQFAIFTLGIIALWWLVAIMYEKRKAQILILGTLTIVIATLLGSVAIINTVAMSQLGHRSGMQAVGMDAIVRSDIQPQTTSIEVRVDPQFYIPTTVQPEVTRVLLVAGLVMGMVALVRKWRSKDWRVKDQKMSLFILLWIIGLGFAWSLPIFRDILNLLPIGKGMLHHYFIALSVFAAPFIAALVLEKILRHADKTVLRRKFLSRSSLSIVAIVVSLSSMIWSLTSFAIFLSDKTAVISLGYAPLVALSAMVSLYFLEKNRKWMRATALSAVAITMSISYFLYLYATTPMPNKFAYNVGNPSYQCIKNDAIKQGIVFPRALSVLSSNTHMTYGIGVMSGYDSLFPSGTKTFHDALNYPDLQRKVYGDNALLDVNFTKTELYRNLGINYIIGYKTATQPQGFMPICTDPTNRYQVYVAKNRGEAVYAATENISASESQQINSIKHNTLFPGMIMSDLPSAKFGVGSVTTYDIQGNTISAKASSSSDGLLFIAQTYNEGWKATVNGKPVKIHKADYNFMTVPLLSGENSVKLEFMPRYFGQSEVVTGVGLCLLIVVWRYGKSITTRLRQFG